MRRVKPSVALSGCVTSWCEAISPVGEFGTCAFK